MERCDSIASQPSAGRLGWFHQIGSWLGTFSLTKSSPICKRHFSCRFSLQKAPDDKGVSSSAELDQQALPAGHPLPFEKEAKLRLHKLGAARQRVGFRTKPIRELGAGSACRESVFHCFLSFFLKKKGSAGSARKRGPAKKLAPSCLGCFMGFGEISVYSLRRRSPLGYGWCRPPRRSPPASGFWLGCRTASSSPAPYRCCLKRCADP